VQDLDAKPARLILAQCGIHPAGRSVAQVGENVGVGVQGMAKELVTDDLWETIEPLLPRPNRLNRKRVGLAWKIELP
jgi:hypothetical protein